MPFKGLIKRIKFVYFICPDCHFDNYLLKIKFKLLPEFEILFTQ